MGFAGYFLIVADFINAGRAMGVAVGPGRGSAAGSAVAYCIGITNIDPVKYNLLFERFLNPERVSMPDIDTDFDDEGRQKVIDYVVDKYGKNQVAQIITYGTMAAKMAIKDVARVLELPLPESNALAKLVPEKPGTTLEMAFAEVQELAEIRRGNDLRATVLRTAEKLEGSVRGSGIHAAGSSSPRATLRLHSREHGQGFGPARHAVRRQGDRRRGHAQDGLSGPQNPHHHPRRAAHDQAEPRRGH
jgi:DNA polymerase-3 subunit alpha